ncbi:phenylacetate--CoA ligase family protein [Paenibacillus tritici]|uniref:phenylacetate--CoA ligase family protein n=1 Tax=Paenibacillus tritici TaxID=1873425 RepID=UPI001BABCF72|nr:phenylacetate--CoA ligase family protein [Paenibacillus tritici]QUL57077.1 phenylacetate--CoA ligase family protein [Paenibacillus tritici]
MTIVLIDKKKEKKLKELLVFLNDNNKYYHNMFNNFGIKVSQEGSSVDEFDKLPIITKKDINKNYSDYISQNQTGLLQELTSGSTGTPLKCIKTEKERVIASVALWKERKRWDVNVNIDNFIPIVGAKTYNEIGDFCDFEIENMKNCFNNLQMLSPRWISGPISVLEEYAKLVEKGVLEYKNKSIKFIELAGEYADPKIRMYLEKIFSCKTTNQYGLRESWCIGYECNFGNIHVLEDIFVELGPSFEVDKRSVNELIITSLYNKAMPFIKYNTHDLGKLTVKNCDCGKSSQVIELHGGRTGDIIRGSREVLGDIFFKRVVNDVIESGHNCIESFRVEQLSEDQFDFFVVRNNSYTEHVSTLLKEIIQSGLGKPVNVNIHYVDAIAPLPSGKMKTFYSHVN